MTKEDSDDRIVELLSEILRWTKVGALDLKEALAQELASDKHRLVYELSDGVRSSRIIASVSGVPFVTVAAWWRRRAELGFVDPLAQVSRSGTASMFVTSIRDICPRSPGCGDW